MSDQFRPDARVSPHTAPMISAVVKSLARVPGPLRSLAVCIACEECFELGEPSCPACGGEEPVPLLQLLESRILNLTVVN